MYTQDNLETSISSKTLLNVKPHFGDRLTRRQTRRAQSEETETRLRASDSTPTLSFVRCTTVNSRRPVH